MIFHSLSSESVDLIIIDVLVGLPAASNIILLSFNPKAFYFGQEEIISFVGQNSKAL